MEPRTKVEILNSSLEKIAEVKSLLPLNKGGTILRYSTELSDYGFCSFRMSVHDPLFTRLGDITKPHKYHIRIMRDNGVAWKGAIVDNPQRNKSFIEIRGAEYEFYLDKAPITRTSKVGYGEIEPSQDIGLHYRVFKTGSMANAVTALINEAKGYFGASHILNGMSVGTIENPDYPNNFSTSSGASLTGSWNFSDDVVLQFDYQTVLYALKAFGIYAEADFDLDENLIFNFKKFLGNKQPNVSFEYGSRGNIADYNAPRFGSNMVNDYTGIATAPDGTVLHSDKSDSVSIGEYGKMWGVTAYGDVKDKNALTARLSGELFLIKDPSDSPLNLVLNEKGYPLGLYGIGDLVNVKITSAAVDYEAVKRIVGIGVNVHNTGREIITVQTNNPKPKDLGV